MVARKASAETPEGPPKLGIVSRLLLVWRRWLTWAADPFRRLLSRRPEVEVGKGSDVLSRTNGEWIQGTWVVATGIAAVVAGAAVGVLLATPGQPRESAIAAGVGSILWAGMRWLMLRAAETSRRRGTLSVRATTGAWALGLVVFVFGVTPAWRLASWVVSAVATWFALRLLGDERREASRSVGIAWGVQAAVVGLSWLARSAILAYLTMRA